MTASHDDLRSMILMYEELSPQQKAEADAHLASCPECRRLFDELALADREADVRVEVPAKPAAESATPGGAAPGTAAGKPELLLIPFDVPLQVRRVPIWAIVSAALAVVAAIVVMLMFARSERRPDPIVRKLHLVPFASAAQAGPEWHTGQAFALEFRLVKPASPVVFHVDPSGYTDLLYPDDPGAALEAQPAGEVRLPQGRTRRPWRFEGGPGPETFLVAAGVSKDASLQSVVAEARGLPLWAGREAAVNGLRALLERRLGPCEVVEIDHQP